MRSLALLLLWSGCAEEKVDREAACEALDQAWFIESIPQTPGECVAPELTVPTANKLAIAVYHFNVQYVAGGLRGFPDGTIVEKFDLSESEVEDRIIRQGLEPVLDLFLANERFKADLEMQAYTVELVAQRHPDVLEKMRTLALRGQIDFDSFHYSDQLYVAYPRRDLEVSLDLTEQVFARACLPLGRSIFTQEGQFAIGQLPLANERGYRVSVLPKNLFNYQFGEAAAQANVLYTDPSAPEHAVILGGQGFTQGDFQLVWTFMDDGEIAFSDANLNPYFGTDYVVDPALIAEHVAQLEQLEANGFVHATIAEAVEAMRMRGIVPAPLPPVLDGTWQPRDTKNVFRWMGGSGLFPTTEKDSDVLASIWRARTAVERAEGLVTDERSSRAMQGAWREVLLAEVSDSTGWNPFVNEVRYSEARAVAAEKLANDAVICGEKELTPIEPPSCVVEGTIEERGAEVRSPGRPVTVEVERCDAFEGATVRRLSITVPKMIEEDMLFDESEAATLERELEVRFDWGGDRFRIVRALEDRAVELDLDDYVFEDIGIPVPIGAISLGPDRWLVQELGSGRVAAIISRNEERNVLRFVDLTVSRAGSSVRRYWLLEGAGDETARAFADRLNRPLN
jgi:hypothetical protein